VDFQKGIFPLLAGIGRRGAGNPEAFLLPVVGPECSIAATERAVAGRDRARIAVELPFDRAAVTSTFHLALSLA
jgi:hypothetical protein